MNKENYRQKLEIIADSVSGTYPKLLVHSCCAPCSSYCLIYLRKWFEITSYYYNPNITDCDEYNKRVAELHRLADCLNDDKRLSPDYFDSASGTYLCDGCTDEIADIKDISVIEGEYDPDRFYDISRGLENAPEGGARCAACYALRLRKTAEAAAAGGYEYFTTTLTISPLKNAQLLNEIGCRLADEYQVKWLPSDFKKGEGYRQSIILSRKFDLYRQNYCGCEFGRMNN